MHQLLEILRLAERYLADGGVARPRLEAEHLLAHTLGRSRLDLYLEFDRPLDEAELAPFRELLRRRRQRVPCQYLIGETEFYGLPFTVDARVLVPRPETEHLVDAALERLKGAATDSEPLVYDVGTGSGCIAVAIAHGEPRCRVVASDASAAALEVARANAGRNGVAGRITFLEGALFGPHIESGVETADVIASNPPYIAHTEWDELPDEVRLHEPRQALDGGPDGLDVIRALIAGAPDRLKPGGWLLLEVGYTQAEAVRELMARTDALNEIGTRRDYAGIERVVMGKRL
ncbi:MAG: peptide chain release factor N(5)-glutamine methyltransferase [Verrucomicrobia bacterium]|nr:peptide chain release factor N(5)-glutamine methyltransferase [Verrucomicrobiota bacterium]